MSRVIILGSTGMAGSFLSKYLSNKHEVIAVDRKILDASRLDINTLRNIIYPGDCVINCVGILKPKIITVGVQETFTVNHTFPTIVGLFCRDIGAEFIHLCSDCVFSGSRGMYTETDTCDATDIYAMSKKYVHIGSVLRTSFIGNDSNPNGCGLMKWLIGKKSGRVEGYTNCLWNGVTIYELAKHIDNIICSNEFWAGVRHIHSMLTVSKYDLCVLINDIYQLNITVNKSIATSIEGTVIDKTLNRSLSTVFKNPVKTDIGVQLEEMLSYENM